MINIGDKRKLFYGKIVENRYSEETNSGFERSRLNHGESTSHLSLNYITKPSDLKKESTPIDGSAGDWLIIQTLQHNSTEKLEPSPISPAEKKKQDILNEDIRNVADGFVNRG